jgi:SPX domain protein involved in polyphosphate accumulation
MKFGRTLREKTLKEWRFYSVDYKAMKKALKANDGNADEGEFFRLYYDSQAKISKFYHDKETWAMEYMMTLEKRVEELRESATSPPSPSGYSSISSSSSLDDDMEPSKLDMDLVSTYSPTSALEFTLQQGLEGLEKHETGVAHSWLKDEYRRMGKSKHFQAFIYAKKSLTTFERELELLIEFLDLNLTAFSKILKKFDKRTGSTIRESKLSELTESLTFLKGEVLSGLKGTVTELIDEACSLKPRLPEGWENRKVSQEIACVRTCTPCRIHRSHSNVCVRSSVPTGVHNWLFRSFPSRPRECLARFAGVRLLHRRGHSRR